MNKATKFTDLIGKTITGIKQDHDELLFKTKCGRMYEMSHHQDCCESVEIEDICGELTDLIGSPILMAEVAESDAEPDKKERYCDDSQTWTFYKLSTFRGGVTIRWYGASNGYYSESVNFEEVQA